MEQKLSTVEVIAEQLSSCKEISLEEIEKTNLINIVDKNNPAHWIIGVEDTDTKNVNGKFMFEIDDYIFCLEYIGDNSYRYAGYKYKWAMFN